MRPPRRAHRLSEHLTLAGRREALYDHVKEVLEHVTSDADPVAVRTAQDELDELRLADTRIPSQLYTWHRDHDKATIDASIQTTAGALRRRLEQHRA